MCGIVAYIGQRNAKQILLEGLRRLEYRGYDSAGIALVVDRVHVFKKQGKVAALEALIGDDKTESTIGIGHTRWATHGEPNDVNAHPHTSSAGKIALVHNGIIENYADLKREIESKGHVLVSETDTEVLTRYIEQVQRDLSCSLAEAVQTALRRVEGAYAIVLVSEAEPDTLIAARKGSPLVIGVGEGNKEFWLASDATPIVQYTRDVVYLDDEQVVVLTRSGMRITDLHDNTQEFTVKRLDMELSSIEKGGYAHFMLKEVMEQPHALADCLRGRVCAKTGHIGLGGIKKTLPALLSAKRLIFVACGTSRHAALVGEYLIEGLARVPVEVEFASEFRYRDPVLGPDDVVIAISQSGETADTLAAMQVAKDKGATVLAICNVVGSSVSRLSEEGCYTQAGPEIGVASTKAFTTVCQYGFSNVDLLDVQIS
jgi:glucosamine--fructose-6-phosphate aminotransferase (isomerizing)